MSKALDLVVKSFPGPYGCDEVHFISPQPDTSRSCKMGLVHCVVCPFTSYLSLVLINRPRRDDTLSWRWYTAAAGAGIRTRDLAILSPTVYHTTTDANAEWHHVRVCICVAGDCRTALGMNSGEIPDSAISASSSFDPLSVGPTSARFDLSHLSAGF